jgi:hypothetical protein
MLCRKQFLTAFIAIRKKLFSNAKSQFNSAEILPDLRYHKDEAKIVHELFKKGSISEDAYYSLVGRVTGEKLLETSIFTFHYFSRDHLSVDSDETVLRGKFGFPGIKG